MRTKIHAGVTNVKPVNTAKHVDRETRKQMIEASFDRAVSRYDYTLEKLSQN